MKKILFYFLIITSSFSFSLAQEVEDTLMIFGRNRFFKVHLPLGYTVQKEYPVVFVFHGGGGNPDNIEKTTDFSAKADKEGFIVVYPYGTGSFPKKLLTWNTWDCCGYADKKNIDDVSFIKKVLEIIKTKYSVNQNMIFATGLSNGGMMCYLLACEMPDQFAAVAPVAATMFDENQCTANSEISMIIFNSIDDKHIPYEGGIGDESIVKVEKMPVEKVVNFWVNKFNCVLLNKTEVSSYNKIDYMNKKGTEIIFYKMMGGGHSWPGGERGRLFADKPVKDVSATDLIWDFFKNHPKQ
ncbi:MAG TPA: alpha/beta hydrolase-fold protein [Ignavibacteriaceae bacterium]|nr:alpha/beta hydrolase-fold protein [Ignavibacteriaceae bacterium]